jgi:two-component system, NarL family, sensor histidine kinase UhpB
MNDRSTPKQSTDFPTLRAKLEREIEQHREARHQIEEYQARLRQLATELSLAEERERREIAVALHDNIIQELAFIKLRVAQFRGDAIFCGFERNLEEILTLIEGAIQSTRRLTFTVSPPILYELGLAAALEWLAEQYEKRHHLRIELQLKPLSQKLPEALAVTLYKCVQELMTNAVKYAESPHIRLTMQPQRDQLSIVVSDNGVGFDVSRLEPVAGGDHGFGLFSIRERLRSFGGEMSIESAIGKGTTVTLTVPLEI